MKRCKKLACALISLLILACSPLAAIAEDRLFQNSIEQYPYTNGSTHTLPLDRAIYSYLTGADEESAKQNIRHSSAYLAQDALISGQTQLVFSYEPSIDTSSHAESMGVSLEEMKPIAIDALAFIVHESNPVNGLSAQQLYDIYMGKITNWSEVGGNDEPISAFQRPDTSASRTIFENYMLALIDSEDSDSDILAPFSTQYTNTPNSLVYSSHFYLTHMYTQSDYKILTLDGIAISDETIASGEYPMTAFIYAIIRSDEPEDSAARQVYDWLGGSESIEVIRNAGYVPVTAE